MNKLFRINTTRRKGGRRRRQGAALTNIIFYYFLFEPIKYGGEKCVCVCVFFFSRMWIIYFSEKWITLCPSAFAWGLHCEYNGLFTQVGLLLLKKITVPVACPRAVLCFLALVNRGENENRLITASFRATSI